MKTASQRPHDFAVAVAEASAWIALLHGPRRTPAAEEGFRTWLAEDRLHREAFEKATDTWNQKRAAIRSSAQVRFVVPGLDREPPRFSWRGAVVWAAAASILLSIVGFWVYNQQSRVTTRIGERRTLALDDGTQVSLNTATRVVVDYSKRERRVRMEAGEALFEVARHSNWPFVVVAGDREITALGTSFLVRRDAERVSVTLVEGKVSVTSASPKPFMLTPGERLTFTADALAPRVDRPQLAKLTAWQQGRVQIDNLSLADAIAEMNRYNTLQLAVEGPDASTLHISGMFRIGDVRNFAQAISQTHGLTVAEEGSRIVLSGTPRRPNDAYFQR